MKTTFSIFAAGVAMIAAPAFAQDSTGTITITGSVAPKCLVASDSGNSFGATIGLGELTGTNGKLRTNVATSFNAGEGRTARVVCTSGAPTISVDANAITAATAADTGYDNSIDFTASVLVTTTGTSPAEFTNDSASEPRVDSLIGGGRLANDGNDNIVITARNFRTNGSNDLLVADPTYTGSIVVVIKPGV